MHLVHLWSGQSAKADREWGGSHSGPDFRETIWLDKYQLETSSSQRLKPNMMQLARMWWPTPSLGWEGWHENCFSIALVRNIDLDWELKRDGGQYLWDFLFDKRQFEWTRVGSCTDIKAGQNLPFERACVTKPSTDEAYNLLVMQVEWEWEYVCLLICFPGVSKGEQSRDVNRHKNNLSLGTCGGAGPWIAIHKEDQTDPSWWI